MYNLIERKSKILTQVAKRYNLELVLLFGSRVSGKTHKHSDFDVAFLSSKKFDLVDESKLIVDLFPVFDSYKVDIVNLRSASPLLFYGVFKNCHLLYAKNEELFYNLRIYAQKKYLDNKSLYEAKCKRFRQEIAIL